ncbi:nucleotide-diphospho-sugar transferase [Ulvibacter sp. MAR_2010_11]|uniref:nucleotide-diphospho-sugar transferase n=1 Tax=Ulvibacter sp. MAR_2010_11 TaxID=1250229 RepID=UPI000C2B9A22|nr:nucleotide-diphospho-sugar transferase [Ulvibacter sp. MAR_2010_11]
METKESFAVLRKVQPKKLYIAADGPRSRVEGEEAVCNEVQQYVVDHIDWDCELKTLFREDNLGCQKAVQGAIDWFFNEEEMGIVLEDDLIPDISFFDYASKLLVKYQYNTKIFSINGCNLGYENREIPYGLTRYFNMWGWATWRRSNELVKKSWFTVDLNKDFAHGSPLLNSLKLETNWPQEEWFSLWRGHFKNTLNGKKDTWDYQWVYTCLKNDLYAIRPNVNLVNNIGFNANATHTKKMDGLSSNSFVVSAMNLDKKRDFTPEIDPKYEIKYVAEKWQNLKIDYSLLLKKLRKKFLSLRIL